MSIHRIAGTCLTAAAILFAPAALADANDPPVFRIELRDGRITPSRIEVPAHTRIKLILHNTGTTPVEFESRDLRKEKVLGPGVETFLVIRNLAPGTYRFFDDFHPEGENAVLVAQ